MSSGRRSVKGKKKKLCRGGGGRGRGASKLLRWAYRRGREAFFFISKWV